jgi:hypothetical protein
MKQEILNLIHAEETISKLVIQESPSSIYTYDDVLRLFGKFCESIYLKSEELPEQTNATQLGTSEIIERIKEHLLNEANDWEWDGDCVDLESAEFNLHGNEIHIDCVSVDERIMRREVKSQIESAIDSYIEIISITEPE